MHVALLIDGREALNSKPAVTDSARDSSDAPDILAKIRPVVTGRNEGHNDAATVAAGGDAGSSQEPRQVGLGHEDHLWSELINSPAFSEWNQKQEELAQRAVTKASDDGRRQSMLLEDDSESKTMEDETTEAGAWAKNEKEDEEAQEAEAEEVVSSVRERKQKRKRKSEKKGRKTSSHRAKKAKQVNDSDEDAEKEEEEEGEKQQSTAPLEDDNDDDDNDPLSLPLRAGWTREVVTRQSGATAKIRKDVYYHAPDGKKLRSRVEVGRYLVQKGITDLSIENFSYNWKQEVKLSEKRKASKAYPLAFGNADRIGTAERRKKKNKKAAKCVPIECVNVRSEERPEPFEYISTSIIHPSIGIRFDVPFVCCSCTDGCQDPTKCECIIKTQEFAGATVPRTTYDSNGRVPGDYPMIMECGRLCKCAGKACSNRATQSGINFKLQLFRTKHKGWGIRTLEDIPSGSFVMEYVGEIITNEMAEKVKSDTYLLDLDMLESMEQWRKQKATEMEEQDRLAAAAAAEAEAEAKAKVKIEQAGDEKASTKKRKRRRKTGVSWSSKTAKRKKPTTIDACDSPQVVMVTDLEATLALATTTTTTMTTTTAMGEKAILKEPKSEPQLFTSLVLQDEDDGEDWYAAQPQVGSEAENDKEEEGEEDSNSVGLRMQLYGEDEPYVVNPHERGNISHFVNDLRLAKVLN
ncbi:MethylCpG binding domain containing protein [Acanthamoeba castellanii str. Neff]|uniref:MethylCpG binding domain containing protein n=1 Tax=Acanthamoeba castellanii (strain ATCC 30010 / Neff) TaxID=1257118 RepID=L8H5Z1_ACACF|nr:MethylCpG binding domain containing protein [Acanthamoeba castellanii str. Neff]ELR20148.1 MethylCpG binding domain containing protein [Acanthamoeba castellanii str. Neff]